MLKGGSSFIRKCPRRNISTSQVVLSVNHYAILGVSRSATLAEIKAAYYRKSKECHPDLSVDEEAANKFREITEAYEVLGNMHSKRLYDKGAVSRGLNIPDTPEVKFHKSRQNIVPTEGYTKIYDFDAWTQAHYSKTFKAQQRAKNIRMDRRTQSEGDTGGNKLTVIMFSLLISFAIIYLAMFENVDEDKLRKNKNSENDR